LYASMYVCVFACMYVCMYVCMLIVDTLCKCMKAHSVIHLCMSSVI